MYKFILKLGICSSLFFSCKKNSIEVITDPLIYNADWTNQTHGNVTPDYTTVFPQDAVNKIEIYIGSGNWTKIRNNMIALYKSDFGVNTAPPPGPPGAGFSSTEPDYVDVTLTFRGKTWKNVGFRLKGNSSLTSAWKMGIYKLPFRLNFDKFEDTYPAINNQHFFGFEELSFSPGFKDPSLIREKMAADVFRMGGIPAPRTSFYRVYIDIGTGMKYWGLYCNVEIPDDNMIKDQYGEESGNIYKPESMLTNFAVNIFEKKNNETVADYADVQQFVSTLNAGTRNTDAIKWRTDLEAIFNMDHFTKYLAINNAIVNWDTYGVMAHNYYLYHHTTKKIVWIPWDNNEALSRSPGITGTTGTTPGPGNAISLSMNEVSSSWPLIRYVADDTKYMQQYKDHLKQFNTSVFSQPTMEAMIDTYYNMITPYVIGADGEQNGYTYLSSSAAFTAEKQILKTHISNRKALISSFLP